MAQAALEAGTDIQVYANVNCEVDHPRIKKTFPYSDMHPLVRFPSVPAGGLMERMGFFAKVLAATVRANLAFGSKVQCQKETPTIWFAVNGSLRNVFALLAKSWGFPQDVFICYLLQDPGRSLKLIETLRSWSGINNFYFAAETMELAEQVNHVAGANCGVVYFPLPFCNETTSLKEELPPLVAGFLGMPRREKGFDVLVAAIKELGPELECRKIQFRLQAPTAYLQLEQLNQEQQSLRCLQAEHSGIELVEEELDGAAYTALLRSCDFLIIPYRLASYARRSSLVPIEGLLHGKPLILTEGLMVNKSLPPDSGAVMFPDGDVKALAHAIRSMLSDFSINKALSKSISAQWKQRHSPEAFVESVVTIANSSSPPIESHEQVL